MPPKSPPTPRFVPLGKILQEWGIKGQVRVLSFNPESKIYSDLSEVYFESAPHEARTLEQAKRHGRYWLFKLKDYENPEQARELRGQVFGLPRNLLPAPAKGEIYLSDLEGLEVRNAEDRKVGEVVGFLRVGDNDVMRVAREEGDEALVPYRSEFVAVTLIKDGVLRLTELAEELL
ncbi:MAG TPA: ribosome maturation factor RimM [bacterium]|nr:ribosome maturation factor RimM [bacterium]